MGSAMRVMKISAVPVTCQGSGRMNPFLGMAVPIALSKVASEYRDSILIIHQRAKAD